MLHAEELPGEHAIPPEGAIDEAVETAKQFCGADAPGFINGILGSVLRSERAAGPRLTVKGQRRKVRLPAAPKGDNQVMRLLVVDDDRGLRDVLRRALSAVGLRGRAGRERLGGALGAEQRRPRRDGPRHRPARHRRS